MGTKYDRIVDLKKLVLKTEEDEFDLVAVQINCSIGVNSNCIATIAVGDKLMPSKSSVLSKGSSSNLKQLTQGTRCTIMAAYDGYNPFIKRAFAGNTYTLFKGQIQSITKVQAGNDKHIQEELTVTVVPYIAMLDAIPVAQMSLVTVAAGSAITKTNFMTMNNRSLAQHTDAGTASAYVNIAEYIQKIIDGVCFEDADKKNHNRLIAGGSAGLGNVLDTSTCPRMSIVPNSDYAIANVITTHVLSMLAQGATYIQTFISLCNMFYLTLVPDAGTGLTKVIPDVAWRKKASYDIEYHRALSINENSTGNGKNQVDAVIVGYTQAVNTSPTAEPSPEGSVVYGEGIGSDGKPRAITNPNELMELDVAVPRKYITAMVPSWVSHFSQPVKSDDSDDGDRTLVNVSNPQDPVCTEFNGDTSYDNNALRWASVIARTMFAQLNRPNSTCSVTLPFLSIWNLYEYIGRIITVAHDSNGVRTSVGRLTATQLNIRIDPQNIVTQGTAILTHVRSNEENEILGIEDCVYVDNW